jgi:hypothetical protein
MLHPTPDRLVIRLKTALGEQSSTSRSDSEYRRYQRTAQRISSGAVCRHLKIAGRVVCFTVFPAYQAPSPKLQDIRRPRRILSHPVLTGLHHEYTRVACAA